MHCNPLVSVLMPAFNARRFLPEAIDSVLKQDLVDFEFIIINDGSRDGSGSLIDDFAARDDRIRVVHQENLGFVSSLNRGLGLARAQFIARMDADDICLPGRLSEQYKYLCQHEGLAVLGGYVNIINENGAFVRLKRYPLRGVPMARYIDHASPVAHPAVMLNVDAVRRVGGYRAGFFPSDDYDLWLRLRDSGYAIENIPRPVLAYRQHTASVSSVFRKQQAIASAVARAASRTRCSGLADPFDGKIQVSMASFEAVPREYRPSAMAAFEIAHNSVSRASPQELRQILSDYKKITRYRGDRVSAGRFLIRAANGFIRNRSYAEAAVTFLNSVLLSPFAIGTMRRF